MSSGGGRQARWDHRRDGRVGEPFQNQLRREMPKVKQEDLDTETGLADDFDAAITDAWFDVPRAEYAARSGTKDPMLMLHLEGPDLEKPIDQPFSIGAAKQWQLTRNGKEVVSGKNPDAHSFTKGSRGGDLVDRMLTLVGGGDKAKGQKFFLGRDRYMTESEFYSGLNFHWKREEKSTVGGEKRDVLMPVVFHGEATGAAKAPTAAPSDEKVAKIIELAEGKTDRELRQAVLNAFKGDDAFLNEVFTKDLVGKLVEQGKLTKGPGGKFI